MKINLKKTSERVSYWLGVIAIGLIVGSSLQFVKAWVEPTAAPPGNNVGAPITTGLPLQQKEGSMYILNNGGKTNGLIVSNGRLIVDNGRVGIGTITPKTKLDVVGSALFSGKVGIGTTDPGQKLDINGKIKINDGTQGAGKVLTSNANGVGSWQFGSDKYEISCSNVYLSGSFWYNCCRIKVETGEAECKYVASATDGNSWSAYKFKPFSASDVSLYQLSCWNMQQGSNFWYNCCRMNTQSGETVCRYTPSVDVDWTTYSTQPF